MAESVVHEYEIGGLVEDKFLDLPMHSLDFTIHLKPEFALSKDVDYEENGRPMLAHYSWMDRELAQLRWTFTNQPNSYLMATRKEEVSYVKLDGTMGEWFTIKNQVFDMSKPHHRNRVLEERKNGRAFILSDVKAVVLGTLQAYNPTMSEEEVVELGGAFWELHSAGLSSFLDTGSKGIVTAIQNDATTTWLSLVMSPPSTTIRDYLMAKLNY